MIVNYFFFNFFVSFRDIRQRQCCNVAYSSQESRLGFLGGAVYNLP